MTRKISLIDVTLRDAHQCLWATRMTTAMMSQIAPMLDNAGFEAIDLVGGAVFDVCVRYLREDPWERMRILSSWVKETPLIVMTRGQSLFTFEFFPDDIVALTAERIYANGIRYHTPYDALNDVRNMEVPVRAGKKAGLYVDAGVVYTVSPVHTDEYYARKIRETEGTRGRRDLPQGPERIADAGACRNAYSGRQGGLWNVAAATAFALPDRTCALRSGPGGQARCRCRAHCHLDARQWCFASGDRDSSSTIFITQLSGPELTVCWSSRSRNGYATSPHAKTSRSAHILEHDSFHYEHQMPGGMISNLKSQLATLGLSDKLPQILEEAARVRRELGYPIIVSPVCAIRHDAGCSQRHGQGALCDSSR